MASADDGNGEEIMSKETQKIEKILEELQENVTTEKFQQMTEELEKIPLCIPAVMPKDTNPSVLRQMAQHADGKPAAIPEGANPHPCILQDREGNKLLPVFTSEEEMKKGKQPIRFPIVLNMPYQACVNMMAKSNEIRAIVVNPYSHNVVINFKKEEQKEKKLTEPQFHALVRQHVESALLPQKVFEEKETFMKELSKRQGECLLELYQPPYEKTKNCPYTSDQFDLMTLQISETMQLIQIVLPTVHLYPGTCPRAFITWNPKSQEAAYYAVVRRNRNEQNQLFQIMPDGTKKDLGEAPSEGTELQSIIDLQNRE